MVRRLFVILSFAVTILIVSLAQIWPAAWWSMVVVAPIILLGVRDLIQKRHTVKRIYPVIGNLRYLFESVRPEIQQYFVESDTNGRPVSREFRTLVYQRAKGVRDTRPFGTIFNVYTPGSEWLNHSITPQSSAESEARVTFGGTRCTQPYAASHLNISAMSYGALSRNAILALNHGAKRGGFSHNTGEGGLSPYHLEPGGDLVWQIGTGYFGCRTSEGEFDAELFAEKAKQPQVKMIEVKLSQGAKPGHGGILPAAKLTEEIARIRHVPLGHDVVSPPGHTAFSTPEGLLQFVAQLRELSGGKPVGFKLCIGRRAEFLGICKAMLETGELPDFITIDGSEGGTGAAPVEFTNSVGTPLREGLAFVHNALVGIGVRDQVRLIGSGKIVSAFHVIRLLALGADTVNSARAMMFSLGCIQARQCNSNTCPSGVATQDPRRYRQLDVAGKADRVAKYHDATIHALLEIVAAAGLTAPAQVTRHHVQRRVNEETIKSYADIYPEIETNCLVDDRNIPVNWAADWQSADSRQWATRV
jgi:glutamate synthase domain-containing protein 2